MIVALALGLLSALSVPLRYDHGNSGRYLLPVLQAADADLFGGDPVVASIERFHSLYYEALAAWVAAAGMQPADVEALHRGLYVLSRVLIVLAVMLVGRVMDRDPLTALYLGVWSGFTSSVPVGGDSLFVNVVTHGTVSFLLGAAALAALFHGKRLSFWLLLAVNLPVHPLMTLHLALCLVPADLFLRRRIERIDIAGGLVFLATLALTVGTAPPFSPDEAEILVAAKGAIGHVALAAQGTAGWLKMLVVVTVALGSWAALRRTAPSRETDLLAAAIVWGAAAAVALSVLATSSESARLVQLQPLRTFLWIHFFSYLLIAWAAVHAWRTSSPAALPQTLFFVLSLVPTLWQYLYAPWALAALHLPKRRRLWLAFTCGVSAMVVAGWWLRDVWPALDTLRNPVVPLLVVLVLTAHAVVRRASGERRARAAALLAGFVFLLSAVSWHRHYDRHAYPQWGTTFRDRVHADWDEIRRWVAGNTPRDARVLVAGGAGNFRTLGLRTAVGEPMSALAWVDPLRYLELTAMAEQVEDCQDDETWRFECLQRLAVAERTAFVLVEGDVAAEPDRHPAPRTRVGSYRVYRVEQAGAVDP